MKEFKGTKGEWIANYSWESETSIRCNGLRIANVKHYISDDLNDPSMEEGRANAKLIAAAPELLEALQDLVRYCKENKLGAELELSQEAINKALN